MPSFCCFCAVLLLANFLYLKITDRARSKLKLTALVRTLKLCFFCCDQNLAIILICASKMLYYVLIFCLNCCASLLFRVNVNDRAHSAPEWLVFRRGKIFGKKFDLYLKNAIF